MSGKHTPGPWFVMENSSCIFGVDDEDRFEGKRVAVANCSDEISPVGGLKYGEERDANAVLVAAAPDLLEQLKVTVDALAAYCKTHSRKTAARCCLLVDDARELIAKVVKE